MNTAKDHYDQQLASVYSWMAGTPESVFERNHALFRQLEISSSPRGLAVDLGAGSGFQSIPLAELGFSVVAVDFCALLLSELSNRANNLPIHTVHDDILNFSKYLEDRAQAPGEYELKAHVWPWDFPLKRRYLAGEDGITV